jgi:hypothetical protein
MLVILHLLGATVVNLFRSRRRLEVENLFLRHQLNIALRSFRQIAVVNSPCGVRFWLKMDTEENSATRLDRCAEQQTVRGRGEGKGWLM